MKKCDVCKEPTRALVGIHKKCMPTYLRRGRSKTYTIKKCGRINNQTR